MRRVPGCWLTGFPIRCVPLAAVRTTTGGRGRPTAQPCSPPSTRPAGSVAGTTRCGCCARHRSRPSGSCPGAGAHECPYDPKHRDVAADECNDHRRDRHLGGDIAREIRRQRDSFDTLGHHPHAADGLLNGPSLARSSPTPLQAAQPEPKSSRNAAFSQYFPPATTRSCCRRRSGADSLSAAHDVPLQLLRCRRRSLGPVRVVFFARNGEEPRRRALPGAMRWRLRVTAQDASSAIASARELLTYVRREQGPRTMAITVRRPGR